MEGDKIFHRRQWPPKATPLALNIVKCIRISSIPCQISLSLSPSLVRFCLKAILWSWWESIVLPEHVPFPHKSLHSLTFRHLPMIRHPLPQRSSNASWMSCRLSSLHDQNNAASSLRCYSTILCQINPFQSPIRWFSCSLIFPETLNSCL